MELAITTGQLESSMGGPNPPLVLDMRDKDAFMAGHISGAANAHCTSVQQKQVILSKLPRGAKIVLVDGDGAEAQKNAAMMVQFGLDVCFLQGGMNGWTAGTIQSGQDTIVSCDGLYGMIKNSEDVLLLDVRETDEFSSFKIPGALNIPLSELFAADAGRIPAGKRIVTVCSHGNRSKVATFALAQKGLESTSLEGGMAGWNQVLDRRIAVRKDGFTITQVEKIGKGCLSYIIQSGGEATVIDPAHPASRYMQFAEQDGCRIIRVIDTHQHADHVSAAAELAGMCGAELCLGGMEEYTIQARRVAEGDTFDTGKTKLRAIHTPGHTAGSMTYVLDGYVFSGDVLFVDGIGRPDLRDRAREFAGSLHDTLHRLLEIPNAVIFPAHRGEHTKSAQNGAFYTTIHLAKKMPLLELPRDEFVSKVADAVTPTTPMNHSAIIRINKGLMTVNPGQIPDLEMGPNRCSISV